MVADGRFKAYGTDLLHYDMRFKVHGMELWVLLRSLRFTVRKFGRFTARGSTFSHTVVNLPIL